jgi:hypothetical protein
MTAAKRRSHTGRQSNAYLAIDNSPGFFALGHVSASGQLDFSPANIFFAERVAFARISFARSVVAYLTRSHRSLASFPLPGHSECRLRSLVSSKAESPSALWISSKWSFA